MTQPTPSTDEPQPTDAALTVLHANIHVGNPRPRAAVKVGLSLGPDTVGWNEAMKVTPYLRSRGAYRTIENTPRPGDRRRVAWDTTISTRASLPALGSAGYRISRAVEPARIAPDRWANVSLFEHPVTGRTAHLCVHLNYIGPHPKPGRPHVEQYGFSVERIQRIIGFLRAQSFKIVLTGDVNSPAGADPWHGSVWDMFERNDMAVVARHIDVIAYTSDLEPVGTVQVVPERRTRADHPWLLQRFR